MSYIYKFLISKIKTRHFKFRTWAYYILVRGFIEFSYLKHIATIMPPVSPTEKENTHSCPHPQWAYLYLAF